MEIKSSAVVPNVYVLLPESQMMQMHFHSFLEFDCLHKI